MKVLIFMKLADINLKAHILPITRLENVDEILIVRDTVGPELPKVHYHTPPRWSRRFRPVATIARFINAARLAYLNEPDLVLGYLFFPHGLMACLVGKLFRIRTGVNLIAGPVEFYGPGSPVNQFPYTRPLPPLSVYGVVVGRILRSCDVFMVGGTFSKSFLENHGFDSDRIHVLRKPMDAVFRQVDGEKDIDVLYLGRLSRAKHVDTIIRSASLANEQVPGIRVAIVGDGPERQHLEDLSRSLGLSDTVTFYGWQDDPWRWLNRSRISILTSEREGFPQAAIQSLYCGVPVVSSNCGDISDIIRSEYNGFIVQDFDDAESYAQIIVSLLQDVELLGEYSQNAIRSVEEHFSMAQALGEWKKILSGIEQ